MRAIEADWWGGGVFLFLSAHLPLLPHTLRWKRKRPESKRDLEAGAELQHYRMGRTQLRGPAFGMLPQQVMGQHCVLL